MAKKPMTVEAEGDSLSEARENLVLEIPDAHELIAEEIVAEGKKESKKCSADTIDTALARLRDELPAQISIVEEDVLQKPRETLATLEAFSEEDAIEKAKSKAGKFCEVVGISLKTAGKKRFLGLLRSPGLYQVQFSQPAVVQITFRSKARIRAVLAKKGRKKDQLYCTECGTVQLEGDWEKKMDRSSKAAGMKGFINLSARPQCLNCSRETLVDISWPMRDRRIFHKERKHLRRLRETPEVAELMELSKRIDFPASTRRENATMKRVRSVGEGLVKKGGLKLMHSVLLALPTAPGHERQWRAFVSASWDGITDESGDRWMC